jgi:hypothetical protein
MCTIQRGHIGKTCWKTVCVRVCVHTQCSVGVFLSACGLSPVWSSLATPSGQNCQHSSTIVIDRMGRGGSIPKAECSGENLTGW